MIIAHQPGAPSLPNHGIEKPPPYLMFHQPLTILGKNGGIETFVAQLHIQKPAGKKVIAHLLTELPLSSNRVQGDQQKRLQKPIRENRRTPRVGIHLIKQGRKPLQLVVSYGLDLTQGKFLGNPFLQVDIGDDHGLRIKRPAHPSS
jgi:hypothetical protein